MLTPPFTLSPRELQNFDPNRAVDFMRELLWAEAARVGIGQHLVKVQGNINVKDGGIDALIKDADPDDDCLIPRGETGFQIKASNLGRQACQEELHKKGKLSEPLKDEIERLLDAGGNYVMVLFHSLTEPMFRDRLCAIKDDLASNGYPDTDVRLYAAEDIAQAARRFPSLMASFSKPEYYDALPYSIWTKKRDVYEPKAFVSDEDRTKWIEDIRLELRESDTRTPVLRVTGLPGIGKTRFVFEALAPSDLRSSVLYVTADQFLRSKLFNGLQYGENLSAILVVDECDLAQHEELYRAFSSPESQLTIVTMSQDKENTQSLTKLYELRQLPDSTIEEILSSEFPALPPNVVRRLVDVSEGYPRIAILLAQSYLSNPGSPEEYIAINDDNLMNRLIGGNMNSDSEKFNTTENVLMGIALFDKIGYEKSAGLDVEACWVSSFMEVQWTDFEKVVYEQKKRGLIQGKYYLYVTPIMLRAHLLRKWWGIKGFTRESFNEFVSAIPEAFRHDLLERFISTIPYLPSVARGKEFVEEILSANGIFSDGTLLGTLLGGKFFLALAEACPGPAVRRLRETIGHWSREDLLELREGRQHIVWALEKIAVWREHFRDAARILLRLAEAENATQSNSASGTFVRLFSPARSPVAPTQAPSKERFPILEEALNSESEAVRRLGLRACDIALVTRHFSRIAGAEYQGLHRVPELWKPETYGELFDAYRRVWGLLSKSLGKLNEEEKKEAVDILLKGSREVTRYGNLADMVVETVGELATLHYVDNLQVLETAMQMIRYDGESMPEATLRKWKQLRDSLVRTDYHSRMIRYVGTDLFEDRLDREGNGVDRKLEEIRQLAKESLDNPELLQKELDWLTTTGTADGYRFGYELSRIDEDFSLLNALIQAQLRTEEQFSLFFLGGYFAAMAERDADYWEAKIDALTAKADMQTWVCKLTWRSRMPSDRSGLRILQLAEEGIVLPEDFGTFVYGGVIRKLSSETFHRWIEFLLGVGSEVAVSNALELFYMYYLMDEDAQRMPMELATNIISHGTWFQPSEKREQDISYHWSEIAKGIVEDLPQNAPKLAEKMLASFGESGTIMDGFGFNLAVHGVLHEIARRFPEDVWHLVTQYMGPPIDTPAFYICEWLRGEDRFDRSGGGALNLFRPESIWKWVDEDVENRAWYLASIVPTPLWHEDDRVCLARELLVRYGNHDDVLTEFSTNYSTEGWTGSESQHHLKTKASLLTFKEEETDANVIRWIDQHISWLEAYIRRAQIDEERRGF